MSHVQPVLPEKSSSPSVDGITVTTVAATTPRTKRRPVGRQVIIVSAVSALSLCMLSTASPAGIALVDALYRSAFGFTVVIAASRSRRWALSALTGIATITAANLALQLLAGAGLLTLIWTMRKHKRFPVTAAIIATLSIVALSMQGQGPLWRLSSGAVADPFGTSAFLTAVAISPVLYTSWKTLSRKQRGTVRTLAKRSLVALAAIVIVTGTAVAFSAAPLQSALDDTQSAVEVASDGDLSEATELLTGANESWERANARLSGPWMIPSRLVPVVGQHVAASQILTGQASAVTEAAAAVTGTVDPEDFIVNGTINVDAIDANLATIDAFARTVERAAVLSHSADSPWLLPPFRARTQLATEMLEPAAGVVGASAQALHVANDLLGPSEPSEILVMFSTPAEARGSGGFIGNWAVVSAADGQIEIVDQYRTKDLNDLLEINSATLRGDVEYIDRYARFDVEEHIQDVTLSPHFPAVAEVAADLFNQATGTQVEAVVMVDPFVIEQLLAFAGPVEVGAGSQIRSSTLLDYLFIEQYEQFETDDASREQELSAVTLEVFDRLLENPPDPLALASELAPLVEQDRLALWLRNDSDGSVAEQLGVDGAFPSNDGDLISVVHQNAGQNKIDSFLQRTIDISSLINRSQNTVQHEIVVTLENSAPSSGLPEAVIGSNDQNLPSGANSMLISVYSAAPVSTATIDGSPAPFELSNEFGVGVTTLLVTVPAQDSVTLVLTAGGHIDLSSGYEVTLVNQPLVNPDRVSWNMQTTSGGRLHSESEHWVLANSGVSFDALGTKDRRFSFDFDS